MASTLPQISNRDAHDLGEFCKRLGLSMRVRQIRGTERKVFTISGRIDAGVPVACDAVLEAIRSGHSHVREIEQYCNAPREWVGPQINRLMVQGLIQYTPEGYQPCGN